MFQYLKQCMSSASPRIRFCTAEQTGEVWQQPQQTCSFPILSNHVIRVSAQLSQCREGLSIPTLTTILCGYLAFFLWVSGSFIYILKISSKTRAISTVWPKDSVLRGVFLQMVTSWQKCRWRRMRACCRQNLMRYQCTEIAVHSRSHVVHFLPPLRLLAMLPTDPSPPCHSMCEAHMVKWNCCLREHASACPDFIRRIKERDEKKNQNKMMIAGLWLFFFSFFFFFPTLYPSYLPPPPTSTPDSSGISRVEHQMTEKDLLLGCSGFAGKGFPVCELR